MIDNARVSRQKIADDIGCDVSLITKHYLGKRKISTDSLVKYANYFHVSADSLLDINHDQDNDQRWFDACVYTGLSVEAVEILHENLDDVDYSKKVSRIIKVLKG